MIKRIRRGVAPDRYEPENWFIRLTDHDDHIHPVSNKPARKDSFIPSKWEAKRVSSLSSPDRFRIYVLDPFIPQNLTHICIIDPILVLGYQEGYYQVRQGEERRQKRAAILPYLGRQY
jgi:hypothetical protein